MKPINFPGQNIILGENQSEYQPLPALKLSDGTVITCWQFTDNEIERIVNSRKMYFKQLTFNQPLQPIVPIVDLSDDVELTFDNET